MLRSTSISRETVERRVELSAWLWNFGRRALENDFAIRVEQLDFVAFDPIRRVSIQPVPERDPLDRLDATEIDFPPRVLSRRGVADGFLVVVAIRVSVD